MLYELYLRHEYIYLYRWQISQNQFIFLMSGIFPWSMLYGPQLNKDDLLFYLVLVTDFSLNIEQLEFKARLLGSHSHGCETKMEKDIALPLFLFGLL